MRYLAAPWIGMLQDGAWLRHARHSNACASRLSEGLSEITQIKLMAPVQANAVFATLPEGILAELKNRGWRFYTFIGTGGARFMCAWDTTSEDVDALLADIRQACGA